MSKVIFKFNNRMTIEEAIKHCHDKAKELSDKAYAEWGKSITEEEAYECNECAHEHEQLAHWLEELVELRSQRSSEFEWCKGCKEHDEENHCCHRLSNFIHTQAQEIHDMAYEEGKNDRPTGEWARHDEWVGGEYIGGFYHINCPNKDGYYSKWETTFCPNCGAKMRKGEEE